MYHNFREYFGTQTKSKGEFKSEAREIVSLNANKLSQVL